MSEEFIDLCFKLYTSYRNLGGRLLNFEKFMKNKEREYNSDKKAMLFAIRRRIDNDIRGTDSGVCAQG